MRIPYWTMLFMISEQRYKYYNEFTWKDMYAECISVTKKIEKMKGKCRMKEVIRKYFQFRLNKNGDAVKEIFSDDVIYSEIIR